MSSVFGEPNLTPSNTTGRSGVGSDQIGYLGAGVLQTIEEGEGAFNPSAFYYSKDVAYYQQPSLQRSHNDDRKTIPIRTFQSRGSVTLTRRWMNMGPALVHLQLPIAYSWSGCEYKIRDIAETNPKEQLVDHYEVFDDTEPTEAESQPISVASYLTKQFKDRFVEVSNCDTILPNSFQSEGLGFAAMSTIELDLGGAGRITYDRYANWAAIMASCPFISQRRELMRMAGGGLDLRCEDGKKHAPVIWGWITAPNATGNTDNIITLNEEVRRISNRRFVPVAWDIITPIKTPDTNMMMNRKPLDTSCLAGDIQYTFTWSNFYEYTDTGCGAPNAPVYIPQQYLADIFPWSQAADNLGTQDVFGWVLPFIPEHAYDINFFTTAVGAPHFMPAHRALLWKAEDPTAFLLNSKVCMNHPRIWTNHYRVAQGRRMNPQDTLSSRSQYTAADGYSLLPTYSGRPRYPQIARLIDKPPGNTYSWTSQQGAADDINKISNIVYPSGFSFAEIFNSSLKLTNPSLGAYSALRTSREATLYYPFSYFYQQIYRISDHPFASILNWNETTVKAASVQSERIYSDQNKITQLIQMPANPVTSMIVGIYREKDRKFLGKNTYNSYSPALFWNAITPLRATLYDGGNILFDFLSANDYGAYSTIDRPDPLFVPFKGGCVKLKPEAINVTSNSKLIGACWDRYCNSDYKFGFGRQLNCTVVGGQDTSVGSLSLGTTNSGLDGGSNLAYNSYPMDNVEMLAEGDVGSGFEKIQPCHLTEMYESCLLEFPFVMHEPIMHEEIVQSTPSFAKTQLKFEFWISPKLKPDNGLDDHYDSTYGLTRGAASGMAMSVGLSDFGWQDGYTYPGTISHPVPDCTRIGLNPEHSDLTMRETIASGGVEVGVTQSAKAYNYSNNYSFKTASSWNINNGALMLHVTFCQNQVWTLSPLHTSVLSSRG